MDSAEIVQQQQKLSLLAKGLIIHSIIVLSFAIIYTIYTYNVYDDFGLKRENIFDTLINSAFLSSFVSSGSVPPHIDHNSSFSRLLLICNVLLSSLSKVWLIASEG